MKSATQVQISAEISFILLCTNDFFFTPPFCNVLNKLGLVLLLQLLFYSFESFSY